MPRKNLKKEAKQAAQLKEDDRSAQILHCTNCDEESVYWNGTEWKCSDCGAINDYPE